MSFTALILYSSLTGRAIVAILALSELMKKSLHTRGLKREIHKLKEKMIDLERTNMTRLTWDRQQLRYSQPYY